MWIEGPLACFRSANRQEVADNLAEPEQVLAGLAVAFKRKSISALRLARGTRLALLKATPGENAGIKTNGRTTL
jgi:hypothetical protein